MVSALKYRAVQDDGDFGFLAEVYYARDRGGRGLLITRAGSPAV